MKGRREEGKRGRREEGKREGAINNTRNHGAK